MGLGNRSKEKWCLSFFHVRPLWGVVALDLEKVEEFAKKCGDFEDDGDVDGSDLAELAANPGLLYLSSFAAEFGRTNCAY